MEKSEKLMLLQLSILQLNIGPADISGALQDQIAKNYDLYLFSKYYLYVLEEAKNTSDNNLMLFGNLFIEFFLNPVAKLSPNQRSIDVNITDDQLLFVHAAVIIMKDQWQPYFRNTIMDRRKELSEDLTFTFFRTMYRWFKILLTDYPKLIHGKLAQIGFIYISIVTPDDMDNISLFDNFISCSKEIHKKNLRKSFFESLPYFRKSKVEKVVEGGLCLEKTNKGRKMNEDGYTQWLYTILALYTDTFRDFIIHMAEEDNRSVFDHLFIQELSELFKAEGNYIMKEWIHLTKLYTVARRQRSDNNEILRCLYMLGAEPEWVDPFSSDKNFTEKLVQLINSLRHKIPKFVGNPAKDLEKSDLDSIQETIKVTLSKVMTNFITLAKYSRVTNQFYYQDAQVISNFIEEEPAESLDRPTALKKRSTGEKSKSKIPFKVHSKKLKDYYADWEKPCGREENIVLYYIFLYLSYFFDKIRGVEIVRTGDGKLKPPKTNLRYFAKPTSIIQILILALVAYLVIYLSWG